MWYILNKHLASAGLLPILLKRCTMTTTPHAPHTPDSPRCKGRPRNFDREKALTQALKVFWQRGYEPASMTELCRAMGINAPSLYAAFGNKATLFLEALRFYEHRYWDAPAQKFLTEPDLYHAVDGFFRESARILLAPDSPCGCMVVLAAINISDSATDIIGEIAYMRRATKDMFAERLTRGLHDGQLPADTDITALAGAFNTLLEGLSMQARDNLSQADLERIAAHAVRLLPDWHLHLPVPR